MLKWTRGPSVYEPKKAGVRTVQGRKGPKTKAVNREDKLSRRYRGRDLAKFERSRRYRER